MSGTLVKAVITHFDSVYAGPNGDYSAVLEALEGIDAARALWKPVATQNSIWQIVEHLIASKQWQIDMLKTGKAAAPVWIEPRGGEEEWQQTLARLENTHQRLKLALQDLTDEELLSIPVPEWGRTLLELVLSSGTAHEAHHSGQIDYLKGLQS